MGMHSSSFYGSPSVCHEQDLCCLCRLLVTSQGNPIFTVFLELIISVHGSTKHKAGLHLLTHIGLYLCHIVFVRPIFEQPSHWVSNGSGFHCYQARLVGDVCSFVGFGPLTLPWNPVYNSCWIDFVAKNLPEPSTTDTCMQALCVPHAHRWCCGSPSDLLPKPNLQLDFS